MSEDPVTMLLKDEYLYTQKVVEDFDARALTIKAWSITFSAAGLALAYSEHAAVILLVASSSAIVFWIIEAAWKLHQQPYYERIRVLERHFRQEAETYPLQIYRECVSDFDRNKKFRRIFSILFWPHVALPHVMVAAAGLALFLLVPPTPDKGSEQAESVVVVDRTLPVENRLEDADLLPSCAASGPLC